MDIWCKALQIILFLSVLCCQQLVTHVKSFLHNTAAVRGRNLLLGQLTFLFCFFLLYSSLTFLHWLHVSSSYAFFKNSTFDPLQRHTAGNRRATTQDTVTSTVSLWGPVRVKVSIEASNQASYMCFPAEVKSLSSHYTWNKSIHSSSRTLASLDVFQQHLFLWSISILGNWNIWGKKTIHTWRKIMSFHHR